MRPEPTDREKIAKLPSPEEVDGFRDQLLHDGRMTPELANLLALHRAALIARKK